MIEFWIISLIIQAAFGITVKADETVQQPCLSDIRDLIFSYVTRGYLADSRCRDSCFRTSEGTCQPCQVCGHNEVLLKKCSGHSDTLCAPAEKKLALQRKMDLLSSDSYNNYLIKKMSFETRRKRQSIQTDKLESKENMKNTTDVNNAKFDSEKSNTGANSQGGISTWVFITIGVFFLVAVIIIFVAAIMYRRRRRRSESAQKSPQNVGKRYDHGASLELAEFESLCKGRDEVDIAMSQALNLPRVKMISASNGHMEAAPSLLRSCVSTPEDVEDGRTMSRSLFSQCGDNENKLRGGNGDFHRRYVDMSYVHNDLDSKPQARRTELHSDRHEVIQRSSGAIELNKSISSSTTKEYSHQLRTKSKNTNNSAYSQHSRSERGSSHHSARSYIRIPPTFPSENYVEVGLDTVSVNLEPPSKMEWLTKKTEISSKNEVGNYQSSSSTQTECGVTSPRCLTVFNTPWQFGGTFTSNGGVLQAKNSDICLHVVTNAIHKGEYVDIYGAVFTDTPEIRRKFNFPAEESLISPMVEYHGEPVCHFHRAVGISLPHSLTEDFDMTLVKVYTFSTSDRGKVLLHSVPMKRKVNEDEETDCYWEKSQDGKTIDISTNHFSGYFCTTCSTTSLPTICSMVFGSHVQINPLRREVRVNLYIWDRRLTIKDYLERIRKQESDVDRQLLTDMQIPLMDDATSDSRVVMRMEVMGEPRDRSCWKHICRADGSSPLFKPLQARRLYDIIQCCRQTDPIRIEWALENVPDLVPGAIFQCCIDIMHVPRDTRDYEMAFREDNDDLMRTFYVRDLKVIRNPIQDFPAKEESDLRNIKQIISDVLKENETEQLCLAFGIAERDIGNLKRKFTSGTKLQLGLIEECLRLQEEKTFLRHLPKKLIDLELFDALRELIDKKVINSSAELKRVLQFQENQTHPKKVTQSSRLQNQSSDDSDTVFPEEGHHTSHYTSHHVSVDGAKHKCLTPALMGAEAMIEKRRVEDRVPRQKKGSSSGSDSAIRSSSLRSHETSTSVTSSSVEQYSIQPQIGSTFEDDTREKMVAEAYPDFQNKWSNSGPQAIQSHTHAHRGTNSDLHSKRAGKVTDQSVNNRLPSSDRDQTRKKEYYDGHTIV